MKVCVYAISKNEEKFVSSFVESMCEADAIYVLDTGSTDQTVNLLKEKGVIVKTEEIVPWRFDVARNHSLEMVPEDVDICVCADFDEKFEPGWREKLERLWRHYSINRLRYLYYWSHDEEGNPATTFHINKIHSRKGFVWKHPVHEVLTPLFEEKEMQTDEIILHHYPDLTKSRSSYLPLLELSVREDPLDDRNMHYLGREYMYYQKWDQAILTLHRHLQLKSATWKDERCASMRYLARCYAYQGYMEEAAMWYEKAILECPYLREGYVEYAFLEYAQKHYEHAYQLGVSASHILTKSDSYINENFAFDERLYDLLSFVSFQLQYYEEAYFYAKQAYSLKPNDDRLQRNVEVISRYAKVV